MNSEHAHEPCAGAGRPADCRNSRRFNRLVLLWGGAYVALHFAFEFTDLAGPLAWTLMAVPVLLSVIAIRAFMRLMREADELMRRIQLESIAAAFAVGIILHLGIIELGWLGVPVLSLFQQMTIFVMLLTYSAAFNILSRRYG